MATRRSRKGDHIRIGNDDAGQFIRCDHCGDMMRFCLPMAVPVCLAMSKAYQHEHGGCQAGALDTHRAILGQSMILVTEGADRWCAEGSDMTISPPSAIPSPNREEPSMRTFENWGRDTLKRALDHVLARLAECEGAPVALGVAPDPGDAGQPMGEAEMAKWVERELEARRG